jgi:hypothetical protein
MKDINFKDLEIDEITGDFILTDDYYTIQQSSDIIINSDKGKIMNNILLGVGITKFIHSPLNQLVIKGNINSELKKEGIETIQCLVMNNGQDFDIDIKTKYKSK